MPVPLLPENEALASSVGGENGLAGCRNFGAPRSNRSSRARFAVALLPAEHIEKTELARNCGHTRLVVITLASRLPLVPAWAWMCEHPAAISE
jgi:hypothetical protein